MPSCLEQDRDPTPVVNNGTSPSHSNGLTSARYRLLPLHPQLVTTRDCAISTAMMLYLFFARLGTAVGLLPADTSTLRLCPSSLGIVAGLSSNSEPFGKYLDLSGTLSSPQE